MDHLQACIQFAFAVFPEPAAFFQPREGPFYNPPFGQHGERMQFVALDDLNRGIEPLHHAVGKRLARVAAIGQQALHQFQIRLAPVDGGQSAVAIGHLGRGYGDGMRQSLRVNRDVTLDAGDFLACVVALLLGAVRVLHALRVNDQKAGQGVAPQFLAGLANGFFLRPAPGRLLPHYRARSTWRNTSRP